mmetsp:Transcript_15073/g.41919  ORF Transcript_15073/g.41919 Transcript_15073/m.41919 type:complete len:299 (+) Transcript_15073:591-1487(+)
MGLFDDDEDCFRTSSSIFVSRSSSFRRAISRTSAMTALSSAGGSVWLCFDWVFSMAATGSAPLLWCFWIWIWLRYCTDTEGNESWDAVASCDTITCRAVEATNSRSSRGLVVAPGNRVEQVVAAGLSSWSSLGSIAMWLSSKLSPALSIQSFPGDMPADRRLSCPHRIAVLHFSWSFPRRTNTSHKRARLSTTTSSEPAPVSLSADSGSVGTAGRQVCNKSSSIAPSSLSITKIMEERNPEERSFAPVWRRSITPMVVMELANWSELAFPVSEPDPMSSPPLASSSTFVRCLDRLCPE